MSSDLRPYQNIQYCSVITKAQNIFAVIFMVCALSGCSATSLLSKNCSIDKDFVSKTFEKAKSGNIEAQLLVGSWYAQTCAHAGSWDMNREEDGRTWYTKAAEQGSLEAQLKLSLMFGSRSYPGILRYDIHKSIHWLKMAAMQGHVGSMLDLGGLFLDGVEVKQDIEEAKYWYILAVEAGNKNIGVKTLFYHLKESEEYYQKLLKKTRDWDAELRLLSYERLGTIGIVLLPSKLSETVKERSTNPSSSESLGYALAPLVYVNIPAYFLSFIFFAVMGDVDRTFEATTTGKALEKIFQDNSLQQLLTEKLSVASKQKLDNKVLLQTGLKSEQVLLGEINTTLEISNVSVQLSPLSRRGGYKFHMSSNYRLINNSNQTEIEAEKIIVNGSNMYLVEGRSGDRGDQRGRQKEKNIEIIRQELEKLFRAFSEEVVDSVLR